MGMYKFLYKCTEGLTLFPCPIILWCESNWPGKHHFQVQAKLCWNLRLQRRCQQFWGTAMLRIWQCVHRVATLGWLGAVYPCLTKLSSPPVSWKTLSVWMKCQVWVVCVTIVMCWYFLYTRPAAEVKTGMPCVLCTECVELVAVFFTHLRNATYHTICFPWPVQVFWCVKQVVYLKIWTRTFLSMVWWCL